MWRFATWAFRWVHQEDDCPLSAMNASNEDQSRNTSSTFHEKTSIPEKLRQNEAVLIIKRSDANPWLLENTTLSPGS